MSGMSIFLSLDGVLIDVAERYHATHVQVLQDQRGKAASRDEYWAWKREGLDEVAIMKRAGNEALDAEDFARRFDALVESPSMLQKDTLLPGAKEALKTLTIENTVVLVVLRREADLMTQQLRRFGIQDAFESVLTAEKGDGPGYRVKKKLIATCRYFTPESWILGDSEDELTIGTMLGVKTVGVLTGVRDRNFLMKQRPDYIVADLAESLLLWD